MFANHGVLELGMDKMSIFDASTLLMLQQSGLGSELLDIVQNDKLQCVYQPIVDLGKKETCAVEGLVRGPFNSVLHHPLNLFKVAEEQGILYEMDTYARISSIEAFAKQAKHHNNLHLFLNISINAVMNSAHQKGVTLAALTEFGISPERVVIEITELQPVDNFDVFIEAVSYYRTSGFKVAIDDLGSGYNGLRIWSEVRPDFVKIDRHFVSDIHRHEDKRNFMATLINLADSMHTQIIAEGVEIQEELEVLQELGVELVQGYLFNKPAPVINAELNYSWANMRPAHKNEKSDTSVKEIVFKHQTVSPDQQVNSLSDLFLRFPEIDYFPVVKDGIVLGMVWRRELMDILARRFGQELHSKKKVISVMDKTPILVDAKTSLVEMSRLITDSDQFGLRDAFIIQADNQYMGCGNFKTLLKKMTDLKVEAAQYANPLSGLPGNVPIQKKLNKLLKSKRSFMLMYIDVDNFKAFNDNYSFEEGDQIISLIASIMNKVIPEEQIIHGESFLGHIGGDDFVVMSTRCKKHKDWARTILADFEYEVARFYTENDRNRGGIEAHDRNGKLCFYPLMSLSIGVLMVEPNLFAHRQQLSSFATKAKKGAKALGGNHYFVLHPSDVKNYQ